MSGSTSISDAHAATSTNSGYFVIPKLHQKQLKLLSKKRLHAITAPQKNEDLDDSKFNYQDLAYPIHPIPNSVFPQIPKSQLSNLPNASTNPIIRNKYITSLDPRNYITTFEYKINEQYIMWDYNTGYVHLTGIWKAIGNSKADIITLLDNAPELVPHLRRIRGGFLKIQGSWVTFEHCYKLAAKFCWEIRYCLVPLFGEKFLQDVLKPTDEGYGELKLNKNVGHITSKRKLSKLLGPNGTIESRTRKKRSNSETGARPLQQKKKFINQHKRSNSSNNSVKPHFDHIRQNYKTKTNNDIAVTDYQYSTDGYFDENNNDVIFNDDSNTYESPIKYNDEDKILASQFYSIHDDNEFSKKKKIQTRAHLNKHENNKNSFYSKEYSFDSNVADIDKFDFKRNMHVIYQPVYPTGVRRSSHNHYLHNLVSMNNTRYGRHSVGNNSNNPIFPGDAPNHRGSSFDSLVFAATELLKIRQNSAPTILHGSDGSSATRNTLNNNSYSASPIPQVVQNFDYGTTRKIPEISQANYPNDPTLVAENEAQSQAISKNFNYEPNGKENFNTLCEVQLSEKNSKDVSDGAIRNEKSCIFPRVNFQNYIFS